MHEDPLVTVHLNAPVTAIDTEARCVEVAGSSVPYDALVLATGSSAFVPPVSGADLPGAFVYRTIEDVQTLETWVQKLASERRSGVRGVVVGGGLLGLEAAGALHGLGVATTVVEFADRLMQLQVDEGGGAALRRIVEGMGVEVRTSTASSGRWRSRLRRTGVSTPGDTELVTPTRTGRAAVSAPAAPRRRSTASSTATRWGSSSRP